MSKVEQAMFFRSHSVSSKLVWCGVVVAFVLTTAVACRELGAQPSPQVQPNATANQASPAGVNPAGTTGGNASSSAQSTGQSAANPASSAQSDPAQPDSPEVATDTKAVPPANGQKLNDLTRAAVEKDWASIESSSGIEDAVKETLRPIYRQAIEKLKQAEIARTQETAYRKATVTAPQETVNLTSRFDELPTPEEAAQRDSEIDVQELQNVIAQRQQKLSGYREELSKVSSELTRVRARRDEITVRVANVKTELGESRAELASPAMVEDASSPKRIADRTLLRAGQVFLVAENQMLEAEKDSQDEREQLAIVKERLLVRQVADAEVLVAKLQERWSENKSKESIELTLRITGVLREATGPNSKWETG